MTTATTGIREVDSVLPAGPGASSHARAHRTIERLGDPILVQPAHVNATLRLDRPDLDALAGLKWRIIKVMTNEQPTYLSRVRVVRLRGPVREAYLPAEEHPVVFSTHSEVREHYGTAPGEFPERATTLDYLVAAAAG